MHCTLLKAKLHHLRVTQAELEYEGSLTIDRDLMDAVGILPYEKLLVANIENGERFETYAICGQRGSGVACLNGAAAHKGKPGDRLIVMVWCALDDAERPHHHPKGVRLDADNRIVATAF
ncbi:MAG: aspartate 1-decarboxylase [Kiritimatiellae bacterium]|nr:aspartate 1-decarboxylase [Kiritimatiellia bacterium]MDD4025235.1 aspartate 1-decarboxylase [Kiritimatiellia bacterium]